MLRIDHDIGQPDLGPAIARLWSLSAAKLDAIERSWRPDDGAPVFTVEGRYTTRGWTDWTEGFLYGSELLQFDATSDRAMLERGRLHTIGRMPPHLTHFGVHDHGFNNVSTYGHLLRLVAEGRADDSDRDLCITALRCSGAVQARRWTPLAHEPELPFEPGFIHSFNGPHSLFVDTIRSLRALALAHCLGQPFLGEQDSRASLLDRLCAHAVATAQWSVYYGEGRDVYDVCGRTAHESLFNPVSGSYRCPSTQQGYSPFTTWARGLAWAMCGFAELLEFLASLPPSARTPAVEFVEPLLLRAAEATCGYYLASTPTDGVPYWDTGAPGLVLMGDYLDRPAEPYNDCEPVDSSAACIAAQGLLRLGRHLSVLGRTADSARYTRAGLTVARTLFAAPYLSEDSEHQGLILHSVYHRPNGWDHVPSGRRVPCGESSMWGDYHARELALLIERMAGAGPYLTFFGVTEA